MGQGGRNHEEEKPTMRKEWRKKEPCLSSSAFCNANLTSLIDEADHGAEEGVSGGDDDGLRKWAALAPEGPPAERE